MQRADSATQMLPPKMATASVCLDFCHALSLSPTRYPHNTKCGWVDGWVWSQGAIGK